MKVFNNYEENEEEFNNFMQMQHDDDNLLVDYLNTCTHKELNFVILNVGSMLNVVATYFGFVDEQLQKALQDNNSRKISKLIRDLNQKINLRYDFDEDVKIIPTSCLYDGEFYLFIDKCGFIKLIDS